MIKSLNISLINPPEGTVFPYKRKVLTEKLFKAPTRPKSTTSSSYSSSYLENLLKYPQYIDYLKDTIIHPGNQVYVITEQLDIEVYTIYRIVKKFHYRNEEENLLDGKVFLYDRKGDCNKINLNLASFLTCIDNDIACSISGSNFAYSSCHICSSLHEVIFILENVLIHRTINRLKESVDKGNAQKKKLEHFKNLIKKYQLMYKDIMKYYESGHFWDGY